MASGRFQLGPGNGHLFLRTRREGFGSKAGHDLTIEVTDWSGQLEVPETGPADTKVSARFQLGSLTVREGTGGARPLTEKDRGDVEANARRTLNVDRYPTGTYESQQVAGDAEGCTIRGVLTLHGTATPVDVRVSRVGPDRYRASAVVKQSAYGIKPYSAFLGALKVRDDVELEIEVDLARAA
jgi:polyisoprenoid-binding protein YceI